MPRLRSACNDLFQLPSPSFGHCVWPTICWNSHAANLADLHMAQGSAGIQQVSQSTEVDDLVKGLYTIV